MKSVIFLAGFTAVTTLGLSYFLMPVMGINGAGVSWLISQGTAVLFTFPYFWSKFFRKAS